MMSFFKSIMQTLELLNTWQVSEPTKLILAQEEEIVKHLALARQKHPLPTGYIYSELEILFDDVVYIRQMNGVLTNLKSCPKDYTPPFVEWRMDGDCVFFQCGIDVLVNRISQLAAFLSFFTFTQYERRLNS